MAVLAINVNMTDLLVAAAELSVSHYPRKVSRKAWPQWSSRLASRMSQVRYCQFQGSSWSRYGKFSFCWTRADSKTGCEALEAPSVHTGAPDWYFAARSEIVDLVLLNLTRDIEHACFEAAKRDTGNHKVLSGRLEQLGFWRANRVGRYLQHNVDLALVRQKFVDDRLPCLLRQSGFAANNVTRRQGGAWSVTSSRGYRPESSKSVEYEAISLHRGAGSAAAQKALQTRHWQP